MVVFHVVSKWFDHTGPYLKFRFGIAVMQGFTDCFHKYTQNDPATGFFISYIECVLIVSCEGFGGEGKSNSYKYLSGHAAKVQVGHLTQLPSRHGSTECLVQGRRSRPGQPNCQLQPHVPRHRKYTVRGTLQSFNNVGVYRMCLPLCDLCKLGLGLSTRYLVILSHLLVLRSPSTHPFSAL